MVTYYAQNIEVRYYNAKGAKEPAHVVLANLELTEKTLEYFKKRFGSLEPIMRLSGGAIVPSELESARMKQGVLRSAWRSEPSGLREMFRTLQPFVQIEKGKLLLVPETLWQFIRLSFALDVVNGKAAVCANPDCPAPYFLRTRKGQQFCSHKCAVLINVRRFREYAKVGREVVKKQKAKKRKKG